MITITLKRTLDDEFISNVLITAFDGSYGGCWYWCEADTKFLTTMKAMGDDSLWTECRIRHEDETGPEGAFCKHVVDAEVIRVGIQRILDDPDFCGQHIREYVAQGVSERDAGHIDADAADVIVQAGLFGELVYG